MGSGMANLFNVSDSGVNTFCRVLAGRLKVEIGGCLRPGVFDRAIVLVLKYITKLVVFRVE